MEAVPAILAFLVVVLVTVTSGCTSIEPASELSDADSEEEALDLLEKELQESTEGITDQDVEDELLDEALSE